MKNKDTLHCVKTMVACLVTACAALSASAEKVFYFNGNTFIDMGRKFPLGNSVSLSAWVRVDPKITTLHPSGDYGGVVYGAGIAGQGYWGGDIAGLGLFANGGVKDNDTSNDGIAWQVRDATKAAGGTYYDTSLFTASEWHHYLVVRDKENGKARFYVDGALCGEEKDFDSNRSLYPTQLTQNFALGKNLTGTGGCFYGWVADVALWNVALTADDAALLPKVGAQGISGKTPYAYFPLDEGAGNRVTGIEDGSSFTRFATWGTLLWTNDTSFRRVSRGDLLLVLTAPYGVGSPAPSGVTTNLAAGATVSVSCGATSWTNATGMAYYTCAGWKLYDGNGTVVSNGTETSFTYAHPDPAEYRKLEWQWEKHAIKRKSTASLYVQDGLLACWDGLENAGPGVHVSSTNEWIDLVGGRAFNLYDVTVKDDRMVFNCSQTSYGELNATDTAATFGSATNGTLEVVYAAASIVDTQIILQSSAASGHAMSTHKKDNVYSVVVSSCYSTTDTPERKSPYFVYTSGTATNSVSALYSSSIPTAVRAGGSWLSTGGGNAHAWTGSTTVTTIGTRTSKANYLFAGGIYCIRVYSRQLTDAEIDANHALDVLRFREGNNIIFPSKGLMIFVR